MSTSAIMETCPTIAPFLGYMGVATAIVFSNVGAAQGTYKAGLGIMHMGIKNPDMVWRSLIPVVMAGVNGIYGLITSIVLVGAISSPTQNGYNTYSLYTGFAHLAAGLCTGLSGLASGYCIGVAGEAAVEAAGVHEIYASSGRGKRGGGKKKGGGGSGKDKIFVAMVLIQVFAGNLALYGLISAVILSQNSYICGGN